MAYSQSYKASAHRHGQAADLLDIGPRRDVAGYVYGVAAECAVKQLMRASGMKPLSETDPRVDPFYVHFPRLKTLLAEQVHGRRQGDLEKLARDGSFMSEWDTEMRYAPQADITDKQVDRWKASAKRVLSLMEGH
jgi:hypothetical protein